MPVTSTCRTPTRDWISAKTPARWARTTSTVAPELFSWCSSSGGVYIGLTLTTTRPARQVPKRATGYWSRFGKHDRDPVTRNDPGQALQPGREAPRQVVKLTVADRAAEVAEGGTIRESADGPIRDIHHGLAGIKVEGRRNTGRVLA